MPAPKCLSTQCPAFMHPLFLHCHSLLHRDLAWNCPTVPTHRDLMSKSRLLGPLPGLESAAASRRISGLYFGAVAVRKGIDSIQKAWIQRHTWNSFHWADVECWHLSGSPFAHRSGSPFLGMQLSRVWLIGSKLVKKTSKASFSAQYYSFHK